MDDRARELARRQHWVVTRAQLRELGLTDHAIDWRVGRRRLVPVHRGVFLFEHEVPPSLAVETAALLAAGPRAALSHETAAHLNGLLPRPAGVVHITVSGRSLASRDGVIVHRSANLTRADVRRCDGLPTTTLVRTLLDLAARRDAAALEPMVAEAMRNRGLSERALRARLDRDRGQPGTCRLRTVLDRPGGPSFTRSKAERRLLALVRRARLPPPRTCALAGGYEVDMLWTEHRLIVEFDGFRFHGDRQAFETDRRRDATLAARGYTVLRLTWRRLVDEPEAVVAELAALLRVR